MRTGVSFGPGDFKRRNPNYSTYGQAAVGSASVYVISGGHGLIKVGFSSDPIARLATLQTASPFPLNLAYSVLVAGDAFAVEQAAHLILDKHRHSGEWFQAPVEAAIAAIHAAAYKLSMPLGNFKSERPSSRARNVLVSSAILTGLVVAACVLASDDGVRIIVAPLIAVVGIAIVNLINLRST